MFELFRREKAIVGVEFVRRRSGVEAQLAPSVGFARVVDGDLFALLDPARRRVGERLGFEVVLAARRRRPRVVVEAAVPHGQRPTPIGPLEVVVAQAGLVEVLDLIGLDQEHRTDLRALHLCEVSRPANTPMPCRGEGAT